MECTPMFLLALLLPLCIVLFIAFICCLRYCAGQGASLSPDHDLYYPPPREYKPTEPLTKRVENFHYGSVPDGSGGVPVISDTGYCFGYRTSDVVYNAV